MSKSLAILALLCVAGCYATDYNLAVYSSSTASQDTILFSATVTDSCAVLTGINSALYVEIAAGTASSTFKISYGTSSSCGVGDLADGLTVDGTAINDGDYYYAITTAATTLTDPSFYVAKYTATGCSDDDFDSEETIDNDATCAAETTVTTEYASLTFTDGAFDLTWGCSDSACSTSCDASAAAVVINDSTDCVAGSGGDAWYRVATSSQDPSSSASALSFALLALCALFALLF